MENEVIINYQPELNRKWVEVILPVKMNDEFTTFTILNKVGQHVLTLKLTGTKHHIDLTFLKLENCYIKIETNHSAIMKRIF